MTVSEWAVSLQLRPHPSVSDQTALLVDALADRGAAVGETDDLLSLTMTATGADWQAAQGDAFAALAAALGGGGIGEVIEVHVRSYDALEAEAVSSAMPALVGTAEVAQLLGVSKTRVGELERTLERFPGPAARLASGPVWFLEGIKRFDEGWERKPGRPRSNPTRGHKRKDDPHPVGR